MGSPVNVSYVTSNLLGYAESLPTQSIRLPLKYPSAANDASRSSNANEQFIQHIATSNQFVSFGDSALVHSVSCSILNDLKTVVLTPVEYKANSLGLKFQNLQLELPHQLYSSKCLSVYANDDQIFLDIIDSNSLLISLQLPIESFIENRTLRLSDFERWGKISVPYSFEMRSFPFCIKTISECDLMVALKDGGLLHFQRETQLADVTVITFSEPVSFIGGLFFGGRKDFEVNGISSNAIVDSLKVGDRLVTLSVSKELKLWDLSKHLLITSASLYQKQRHDIWLTGAPTTYLRVLEVDGASIITFFITTTKAGESKKSRFAFKSWEVAPTKNNNSFREIEKFDFQPELPNSLLSLSNAFYHDSHFQNSIWFIQDFDIEKSGENELRYHILWKSNTSSMLVSYTIDFTTGEVNKVDLSQPPAHVEEEEISVYHDSDYYQRRIFASGKFDNLIVSTSLTILRQHLKASSPEADHNNTAPPPPHLLRTEANQLISSNSPSGSTKRLWFKLLSLCEEFAKLSQEAFSVILFKDRVVTAQANGYGIFRPSSYYESISYKDLESPDGKLTRIFDKFKTVFSAKSYHRLHDSLLKTKSPIDVHAFNDLFQNFLSKKLSDNEIQVILQDLSEIPGVLDIIKSLIPDPDFSLVENLATISKLGDFLKLASFETIKNISSQHCAFLLDLTVLLLVCEANEEILKILNSAVESIKSFSVADTIFDTCFTSDTSDAPIEVSGLSNPNYSLFWSVFVSRNKDMSQLLNKLKTNEAYDYFYNDILSGSNRFLTDAVIELINHKQGKYLQQYFCDKLDPSNVGENFLLGFIQLLTADPQGFAATFANYDQVEHLNVKCLQGLKQNGDFANFLETFDSFPTKSEYYHALSVLALSPLQKESRFALEVEREYIGTALHFEQLAIDNTDLQSAVEEYYLNIYDLASQISDYQLTITSLIKLEKTRQFESLLTKFIQKIIQESKIKLIVLTPGGETSTFFRNHYSVVASIIAEYASEQPLVQSLKIYKYLYSWKLFGCVESELELGDKRGAVEALYEYIVRFKDQSLTIEKKAKLEILELYMIILNCIKTFPDEDQWLVKRLQNGREVVEIKQLKIEYYEWMKKLDDDLSILY
ncbi:uncharacterized protein LODBEIA_P49870 [Lodderomyces beijingensis]|uniref:Nucleoporin Nup120/160 beta-propeller domain-containing protein n=1 Tax=Lodderomyces beijingensis TaxID=1775926 RepID=A0ABP0ZRH4_9ASCO